MWYYSRVRSVWPQPLSRPASNAIFSITDGSSARQSLQIPRWHQVGCSSMPRSRRLRLAICPRKPLSLTPTTAAVSIPLLLLVGMEESEHALRLQDHDKLHKATEDAAECLRRVSGADALTPGGPSSTGAMRKMTRTTARCRWARRPCMRGHRLLLCLVFCRLV